MHGVVYQCRRMPQPVYIHVKLLETKRNGKETSHEDGPNNSATPIINTIVECHRPIISKSSREVDPSSSTLWKAAGHPYCWTALYMSCHYESTITKVYRFYQHPLCVEKEKQHMTSFNSLFFWITSFCEHDRGAGRTREIARPHHKSLRSSWHDGGRRIGMSFPPSDPGRHASVDRIMN